MHNMEQAMINQLLGQWNKDVAAMTAIFEREAASNGANEIAPQKNSVMYLLGHMTAVHDRLVEALDAGERTCADLDKQFLEDADSKAANADYRQLLDRWKAVSDRVSGIFSGQTVADWMKRHHYVSDADFAKEPHRNRLAILISRLAHLNTHLGQLKLLK